MVCLDRPPPGPILFGLRGLDTLYAFGPQPGVSFLGLAIQGILLIVFGYRTWFSVGACRMVYMSTMRTLVILYCIVTGLFFFFLGTQLNKVVVILAGLHNLFEWGMLACLAFKAPQHRKAIACAVVWIWAVWICVMEIQDTLAAFIFEEVLGLWPDFILLLTSWIVYYRQPGESKPGNFKFVMDMWRWGSFWHILQIFTLLFQGFRMLDNKLARIFTFITVLPNYYYYSEMALRWDGWMYEYDFFPPLSYGRRVEVLPADGDAGAAEAGAARPDAVATPPKVGANKDPNSDPEEEPLKVGPGKGQGFRWLSIMLMMLGCFILSFFSVIGPVLSKGLCNDAGQPCMSINGNVWTLQTFNNGNDPDALRTKLQDLIPSTIDARGNLYHSVFAGYQNKGVRDQSGDFLVVSKWDSLSSWVTFRESVQDPALAGKFKTTLSYTPLVQLEGVPWLDGTCADAVYSQPRSPGTTYTASKGWCESTTVTGVTVSESLSSDTTSSMLAMTRPLASRTEPGNKFMHVFTGGVDLTQGRIGGDVTGQVGRFFAFEQWETASALDAHLHQDVVTWVLVNAALFAAPGGVSFVSPFHEIIPCA